MDPNTINVVTSCSLAGWNKYGLKCLEGIGQYWPKQIQYHIVSEEPSLIPLQDLKRVRAWRNIDLTIWSIYSYLDAQKFYDRHMNNHAARGLNSSNGRYDFRKDAWRFSKKVFSIALIASMYPYGRLIWMDADTITLKEMPYELLTRLPPDGYDMAYLDRSKIRYHSECGFIGYNLNRPTTMNFITAFSELYASDRVFSLKEWHDSWVFDWLRANLKSEGYQIPYTDHRHPFNFSELGQYLDHLKGRRKDVGVSTDHPRFVKKKG
jgi:hypothetical protein